MSSTTLNTFGLNWNTECEGETELAKLVHNTYTQSMIKFKVNLNLKQKL